MSGHLPELASYLVNKLPQAISDYQFKLGELTVQTGREHIIELLGFLRNDENCRFVCLLDICGVDWPGRAERFDVVYHLLSPTRNLRLRVKLETDEESAVPSACALFPCADWYEREAWDMYGILFTDHPDLRRILTDYGFKGHPLRKDFPLTGFVEVRYDDAAKRVIYEPVELKQEYRHFDFLSPWEGTDYVLPGDEKSAADPSKQ
ncbi:NADH-quinone oxidoreductase subunit C [Rhizobium laguerreae]|uniref:NADH-quinone oxidoreductase subunit C n=1 Tax=Rhizobium laguerreae TaxID=1076926 RepID=UPI001C902609|nr:NADH-quinone oxidoreductase subunit C [Rhizobium laguerreae]MBY3390374.1 NADH-quinone oxidoreductase subunit C [Rhizobium laguerreae]MBY3404034.1 NADH-quinone oxidoreductase subunit C [Rhizobium laguerreae]MBY3410976.1 NADH-quinone oxidoreductase subunit C [Rhizobium laguerreae]